MLLTKNFNLLVSTSRYNETNAKSELWFTLLICGEKYPIISDLEFSGLITALTSLNARDVIYKIKDILKKDPDFFQYILKITIVDFVCETNVEVIKQLIEKNNLEYLKNEESFKISLKRRKHEQIDRDEFIETIAKNIDNKVDLGNPDKTIRVEVLGNFSAISYLTSDDGLKIKKK